MPYKVFLSFSSQEKELAEYVKTTISNAFEGAVEVFFSPLDILPGANWKQVLQKALKESDAIILILTPRYITRPWAYIEWSAFWLNEKDTFVMVTDDLQLTDMVEPMKDFQVTRLFVEEDIEKFLKALSKTAAVENIPFEVAFDFANISKMKYGKIYENEERKRFDIYRQEPELLPNDDFLKKDIFWYFYEKESDKQAANQVFQSIQDNSLQANILRMLVGKGDFDTIESLYPHVKTKSSLGSVVRNLIEGGEEDSLLVEKMIEDINSKSQSSARFLGSYLIENGRASGKLINLIIDLLSNQAELRKLGENLIDNGFFDRPEFDKLVDKFYGHNHAELQKLLIYGIQKDRQNPNEIESQITRLAKQNQREAEKVLIELAKVNAELARKLVFEKGIITTQNILDRLAEYLS